MKTSFYLFLSCIALLSSCSSQDFVAQINPNESFFFIDNTNQQEVEIKPGTAEHQAVIDWFATNTGGWEEVGEIIGNIHSQFDVKQENLRVAMMAGDEVMTLYVIYHNPKRHRYVQTFRGLDAGEVFGVFVDGFVGYGSYMEE
ncbi:hypothetical protein GYB22_07370 [bacterium]|nr:hypothetical protein [bacterium]